MTVERDDVDQDVFVGRWRILLRTELSWIHGPHWAWKVDKRWNSSSGAGDVRHIGAVWTYPGLASKREAKAWFDKVVQQTIEDEALEMLGVKN